MKYQPSEIIQVLGKIHQSIMDSSVALHLTDLEGSGVLSVLLYCPKSN